jgi:predicted MPP superfamily phosphohydrolase
LVNITTKNVVTAVKLKPSTTSGDQLKIALISDTHIDNNKQKLVSNRLDELVKEGVDVLIHAGDYNSQTRGAPAVKLTIKLIRERFPDTPVLSTLGNHDMYSGHGKRMGRDPLTGGPIHQHPSVSAFMENQRSLEEIFKSNNVHFIDLDGVYRHPSFQHVAFVGTMGWYQKRDLTATIDYKYMPLYLEGDTYSYLSKREENQLFQNLDQLTPLDTTRVFISHFPVIKPKDHGWSRKLGAILKDQYKINYFLNGHMHERRAGPKYWESGSWDKATSPQKPNYILIEIN